MVVDILDRQTLLVVRVEAFSDQVLEVLRNCLHEDYVVALHLLQQGFLACGNPGRLAMQHLEKYGAKRPDVVFGGVDIVLQGLGAHVEGRSYVDCFLGVGGDLFSEAEVGDFDGFVLDEDVGRFEVSVKKAIFGDVREAHDNFPDEGDGLLLGQLLPLFEEMLEIPLIAKLGDDVALSLIHI